MSFSNNNLSFFPEGIFYPQGFLKHLLKGLKSSLGSLLQSFFDFLHEENPLRDISPPEFSPWGFFLQTVFHIILPIYL